MGTSMSHPSLPTLSWRSVNASYDDSRIPPERVAREIWRAAKQTPDADVFGGLTSQAVYSAFVIAQTATEPLEAHRRCNAMISESKSASLLMEVAKRAVVQSVGKKDQASEFVSNLFREATNYFVSRDLPGHLGSERVKNVQAMIGFKSELIRKVGESIEKLEQTPKNHKEWSTLVTRITEVLSK